MTVDQINAVLAERVMGWTIGPDRFMTGGRCWQPRWRFQPAKRLEDAVRLLQHAAPQEYSMGGGGNRLSWACVRIASTTGEAREPSLARAITFAVARAIGVEV